MNLTWFPIELDFFFDITTPFRLRHGSCTRYSERDSKVGEVSNCKRSLLEGRGELCVKRSSLANH